MPPCTARPHSTLLVLAGTLALFAPAAVAQVDSFSITDGSASFSLNTLRGPRTGSANGSGSFTTGSPSTNHMFQNWFWISAGTDTREYALSNQTFATGLSGNAQGLEYLEPANNGAVANALKVRLDYTLHDLSVSPGRTDEALLTITCQVSNRLPTQLASIQIFHYIDFDAAGTGAGDSAVVRGVDNQTQVISDAGSGSQLPTRIDYSVSSATHLGYQIGTFPAVRNLLSDASATTLSGAGSPYAGSDYSGANQWWLLALGPAGGGQDTFTFSVTIHITTKCKADFNESGSLEVQDIFDFLNAWFAGCP
jgi:hypothetical protein